MQDGIVINQNTRGQKNSLRYSGTTSEPYPFNENRWLLVSKPETVTEPLEFQARGNNANIHIFLLPVFNSMHAEDLIKEYENYAPTSMDSLVKIYRHIQKTISIEAMTELWQSIEEKLGICKDIIGVDCVTNKVCTITRSSYPDIHDAAFAYQTAQNNNIKQHYTLKHINLESKIIKRMHTGVIITSLRE